jgi:mxaJ protein
MRRVVCSGFLFVALGMSGCGRPPSPLVITSGPRFRVAAPRESRALTSWQETRVLRVCSDPDNLPFSNFAEEGVENRIAELIAADLNARLEYTWWPSRRGIARHPLKSRKCDLILSLPARLDRVEPTAPYYQSTYMLVSRREAGVSVTSLDDPLLKRLRIGVPLSGEGRRPDSTLADALARRGLSDNVTGYRWSDDSSAPQGLWQALASGEADAVIVWGPLAGYFAKHASPLGLVLRQLPLAHGVSAGVRSGDAATRESVEEAFSRHAGEIRRLLLDYGFPLVEQ